MRLPNLELLVYKAQQILAHDEEFVTALKAKHDENRLANPDFAVEVFPQWWGSTCTGFDVTENGEAVMSGSAMTEELTTVVIERTTGTYCVFFGDRPCYKVANANEDFLNDLAAKNLRSLSQAKLRY